MPSINENLASYATDRKNIVTGNLLAHMTLIRNWNTVTMSTDRLVKHIFARSTLLPKVSFSDNYLILHQYTKWGTRRQDKITNGIDLEMQLIRRQWWQTSLDFKPLSTLKWFSHSPLKKITIFIIKCGPCEDWVFWLYWSNLFKNLKADLAMWHWDGQAHG